MKKPIRNIENPLNYFNILKFVERFAGQSRAIARWSSTASRIGSQLNKIHTMCRENKIAEQSTRNIFWFGDFGEFDFFVASGNHLFCDFAFFFATGGARRKIQNHQKGDFQMQQKNRIHQNHQTKKCFAFDFCVFEFCFPDNAFQGAASNWFSKILPNGALTERCHESSENQQALGIATITPTADAARGIATNSPTE